MGLAVTEFDYVRTLLREQSGMALEAGKEYLVETRLTPVARQVGCNSVSELIRRLRRSAEVDLQARVVEALTTNETQFFRDVHPFDALKTKILPELIFKRARARELNLWCAAASTGQEPYSLAMLLDDSFPQLAGWNVRCVASDISDEVLQRARQASYRQFEVDRGLPDRMREKYFRRQDSCWQLVDLIRRRVEYRNINLALDWPHLPLMDLILMRNVLIYFNTETKKKMLARVRRQLRPDGYLFLGSAETTINLDPAFEQVYIDKTVCYRLRRSKS